MGLSLTLVPLLGKHTTKVTVTNCSAVSSGGAPTFGGTAYNLLVPTQDLSFDLVNVTSEISGASTQRQNNFVVATGYSFSISVIKVNDTTTSDKLLDCIQNAVGGYIKVEWTQGTATGSIMTCVGYLCVERVSTGHSGKAQQIATLTGVSVDFGQASYFASPVT